jgi:hypothetical protein
MGRLSLYHATSRGQEAFSPYPCFRKLQGERTFELAANSKIQHCFGSVKLVIFIRPKVSEIQVLSELNSG